MTGPGWAAVWTLIASVVATGVASVTAFIANRRRDRLRGQLDFVNSQLREFYGPLLAIAETSEQAWTVFKKRYNPAGSPEANFWDPAHPPSSEARAAYKHWMNTLFLPLDDKLVDIIVAHADLLIDAGMPQCLTDLCAHTLTIKALLSSWDVEAGGAPDVPPYPATALLIYLEDSFSALKREQVRLLKAVTGTKAYPLTQVFPDVALISDTWRNLEGSNQSLPCTVMGEPSAGNADPPDASS
jgi:hypothetical protein